MPEDAKPKQPQRPRFRRETVFGESYDPVQDHQDLPKPPEKTPEQLNFLVKTAKKTFMGGIDDVRLRAALSHMKLKDVKAGDIVYKQGEPANSFYIVEQGTFKVFEKSEGQEDELGTPGITHSKEDNPIICELAALFCEPRHNTLKAETEGKLWELERALYTRVVVKLAWKKRQRNIKFMNSCPLLNLVEPYEKTRLCDAFISKNVKAGDVIIEEGDEADGMYWIVEGSVEVKKKDSAEPIILKERSYFGEMGLLSKKPRNATCTAKTDCELAFLGTEGFERLMGKLHNIMLRDKDRYKEVLKQEFDTDDMSAEFIR